METAQSSDGPAKLLPIIVSDAPEEAPSDGPAKSSGGAIHFVFRGRRGDIVKLLWFDGDRLCLLSKRLERSRFVWPQILVPLGSSITGSVSRAQHRPAQDQLRSRCSPRVHLEIRTGSSKRFGLVGLR